MKTLIKTALILTSLLIPGEAWAVCSVSTTSVSFGSYDINLLTPVTSTGTITVSCNDTPPAVVTITIGPSPNSGGFNPRRMRHTTLAEFMDYNLYTDAVMTSIWGDGTAGTSTLTDAVRKNRPWVATVYGRVPAGQDINQGLYSETLTVTILP